MKILNDLRYTAWRLVEGFKKDSVYKRLKRIERIMADDKLYAAHLDKKLSQLLNFASRNIRYYEKIKYNAGKLHLEDFPVINKNTIMDDMTLFQCQKYDHSKLHTMATSGSTGRPFKITQDIGKRKQVLAEVLYFTNIMGYRPGKKLVYLRNQEGAFTKSKFKSFLQNEDVIMTRMYDDETLSKIVRQIASMEKGTTILGYASTLQCIASYLDRHKQILTNITGVISGAETLNHKTRELVLKQFSSPVVSRYSNQEMGILAQESQEDEFVLNRASYYFELLHVDKDEPVKEGEIGRIVITDLYNYATPLIRYDTGDLGIMGRDSNGRLVMSKICGRKLDLLYTTKNEPISFFALDEFFEQNYDLDQYQIIQESRYDFTLNLIVKEGRTVDEDEFVRNIQSVMGADSRVKVVYLKTVPITASGKFRYVICNYKPSNA